MASWKEPFLIPIWPCPYCFPIVLCPMPITVAEGTTSTSSIDHSKEVVIVNFKISQKGGELGLSIGFKQFQ